MKEAGTHVPPFLDWELHWKGLTGPWCAAGQMVPPTALGGASHVDNSADGNP